MKKLIVFVSIILMSTICFGQQMTAQEKEEFEQFKQYQKMKSANPESIIQSVSKYAGLGVEMGSIIKDCVGALDDTMTVTEEHVYRFIDTSVGKVTLAIIAWKVIGEDIVGVVIGFILLILFIWWVSYGLKIFFVGKSVLVKQEGKIKTFENEPSLNDSMDGDAYGFWCMTFAVGAVILFGGSMICFF